MMQPILTVNLSTREIGEYQVPISWQHEYLGGASLAARILYNSLTEKLNPLSPEAPILYITGPLTGTSGPVVGRFVICGKSPATGLWAESNCGGHWGVELRKTGYDGIWITGQADAPVYLAITDASVELRSSEKIWGQDTAVLQEMIQEDWGQKGARTLGIGIAGENQIPYALILTGHGRVAGRTGMGAVMGSKHLKAISVRGRNSIPVESPDEYKRLRSLANRELKEDVSSKGLRELGSAATADYFDYLGEMPKKGFSQGVMDGVDKISGSTLAESIVVGVSACHACVIACGRVVQLPGEKEKRKGPEYETIVGFGGNLWINDPVFITLMGELCDLYGLDSISASSTIAFAMTLYENGKITLEDTGGIALNWGDGALVEQLLDMLVQRKGFGAQLAEGSRALGKRYGAEDRAVQVNGLEVAYHDPRGASGMALVYATSPRGACHNQSDYFLVDIGQADEDLGLQYFERHAGAEKAQNVAIHQDWRTVFNALVMCVFGNVPPQTVVDLINAAMNLEWSIADMMNAGERGWQLKRAINNRLGLTRQNDRLPAPLLEPLPNGGAEGYVIPFDDMLDAYYIARDWDKETGKPARQKLLSLGLNWVADDLWPEN